MGPTNENSIQGNALIPFILSEAATVAHEEGITDEELLTVRTNEITEDAIKETPETEIGTKVRAIALAKLSDPVKSPYAEPKFDYAKLRDETTLEAAKETIALLGQYPLLIAKTVQTEEDKVSMMESYEEASLKMFEILNKHKVGFGDYQVYFGLMNAVITSLEQVMLQQVSGHRGEIIARILGAKNPGNGKFAGEYATYADITKTLESVREATGNRLDDYFNMNPDGIDKAIPET